MEYLCKCFIVPNDRNGQGENALDFHTRRGVPVFFVCAVSLPNHSICSKAHSYNRQVTACLSMILSDFVGCCLDGIGNHPSNFETKRVFKSYPVKIHTHGG